MYFLNWIKYMFTKPVPHNNSQYFLLDNQVLQIDNRVQTLERKLNNVMEKNRELSKKVNRAVNERSMLYNYIQKLQDKKGDIVFLKPY